ncbi:MAG: cupredoxin domain-containing protein [Nitrospinota bacterium]
MILSKIIVTMAGFSLIGLIIWFFFFSKREGVRLASSDGVQEVMITVKGGYNPDVIVVKAGQPVRLNFNRQETAVCSEMVIFDDFNKSANLPPGEVVSIEFTPPHPGEYKFHCQMGMLQGKVVAE